MINIVDLWHWSTQRAAERAGVTETCSCRSKVASYPTARHGRGRQWRVSGTVDGRPVPTRAFTRKADAEAWERKLIRGEVSTDRNMGMDLLKNYAESFIARHYPNPRSRTRMSGNLTRHVLPYFGENARLKDIDYLKIENWKAWLRDAPTARTGKPLAPSSQRHAFDLLSVIFADAVAAGKLDANPMADTKRPAVPARPELTVWEESTVLKLLAAIPDRHHGIALVAATSGLRKGEVFGLAVQDIGDDRITVCHQLQWENGRPVLVKPKWQSVRSTGLHPDTALALRTHIERYPTGIEMECRCGDPRHLGKIWTLIFADENGKPLYGKTWDQKVWHPVLRAVGLDPSAPDATGLHQLRHHAASLWIDAGLPELLVGRWLGHRDPKSTRIYSHLFEKAYEKAQDKLRSLYDGRRLLRVVNDPQPDHGAA